MGNGTYIGGSTVIGSDTPDWFGWGDGDHLEREVEDAEREHARLIEEGQNGRTGPGFRKELREVTARLEELRKLLASRPAPKPITSEIEQEIATLRRGVSALHTNVRSALALHEAERARLEALLREYGNEPARYSETRKLELREL